MNLPRLNVVIKEGEESTALKVKEFVSSRIREAKLLDESAGSLLYSVPFSSTDQLTEFLNAFEESKEIKALVEDMSVSNSTLEEVFITVTKEDEDPRPHEQSEVQVALRDRQTHA